MRPSLPVCLALFALGLAACNDEEPEDTGTPSQDDTGLDDTGLDDTGTPPPVDQDQDGYASDVDCDDNDHRVHPGAIEQCDGLDNDCDGAIDEDFDLDGDGWATCFADCDDEDASIHPEADEVPYDGIDQDCDGVDLVDVDGDGFRGAEAGGNDCDDTNPDVNPRATEIPKNGLDDDCRDGDDLDADNDGYDDIDWGGEDCDDTSATVHPGAEEVCDGADNDCNGVVDEVLPWYFEDVDGDGWGDDATRATACDVPKGAPDDWVLVGEDCDVLDPTIHPEAEETPYDGIDQDCDGDDLVDVDGDGYLAEAVGGDDCDDYDATTYPSAPEYCDGADNDCDGETDPDTSLDAPTWYYDADGDTFGDPETSVVTCYAPDGYVDNDNDCDDTDSEILRCTCELTEVARPTTWVRSGSTYGQWMADPLETLGEGIYWEMDSYTGYTLTEYASLDDLVDRSSSATYRLPVGYNGTGAVVYDGYLYYNEDSTNTLVKYDIATEDYETLSLSDAGYHNTYHYQWGGYSDIDFAVDEEGLWVLYATAANEGRMVISSIDPESFTVTETWETDSTRKTSVGNAFMICGVMYTVTSYSSSTTTIGYAYDTSESTSSTLSLTWYNDYSYNSMIDYNPGDETIYAWDSSVRVTYTPTTE